MGEQTALSPKLGRFEISRQLGKGSMGIVFLGYDPVLERDVAIKIMGGTSIYDRDLRERFEKEAKAVAHLHHPNIVTVHDLGYTREGLPFIAMELLEGRDLDELIGAGRLTLSRKLEIIVQICGGLEHAHQRGIIHRDIKPANIFVTTEGIAKIMDFGVARWTQSAQTQAGLVVGTAGYIAPEQIRGQRVDARSDVFSLGAVLYEVLTAQPLYPGDSIEAIFFSTLSKTPPVLTLPDGAELPALQKIVNRALARDPETRFPSAGAFGEALASFARQHVPALSPSTVFCARETVVKRAHKPPPTIDLAAPAATARAPRRATPRGRSRRGMRLPLIAALGLFAGAAASSYFFFVIPGDAPRSPAPSPREAKLSPEPSRAMPSSEPVVQPPSPEASAALVADAAFAVNQGHLDTATALIAEGQRKYPDDSRWAELREQVRTKEVEAQGQSRARDFVRQGRRFLQNGSYRDAIDSFQQAMHQDPANADARAGLDAAIDAQRRVDRTSEPARRFSESQTEFVPGTSHSDGILGFEPEEGLEIMETADPFFPATIVIELDPADARAGETYSLRVEIFNEGYTAVEVRSLELISRFGDQTTGKGQPIPLSVGAVAPQQTTILHEISGIWKETQNHAEVRAVVTLVDGSKLIKELSW